MRFTETVRIIYTNNYATAIIKWVRGELISESVYGKVYIAMNVTTGEMIAIKQVEIPRTESDRSDSRRVTIVEALKLESNIMKDLDHPNIVQYLGFEESPRYLTVLVLVSGYHCYTADRGFIAY